MLTENGCTKENGKADSEMKKVLVVVDMQNDFIDGSLGTVQAQGIVSKVISKIKSYSADCIYATRDTHGEDYLESSEGKNLPVVHCVKGNKGWEIRPEVAEAMPQLNWDVVSKRICDYNVCDLSKIISPNNNVSE